MKPSLHHPNTATAELIDLVQRAHGRNPPAPDAMVDVEVVIPTYNEERILATSIYRLHRFLRAEGPTSWRIVIADNASTYVGSGGWRSVLHSRVARWPGAPGCSVAPARVLSRLERRCGSCPDSQPAGSVAW